MFSLLRSVAAAATALVLALSGAVLLAAPAHAADGDPVTPGWEWKVVRDDARGVQDVNAYFPNFEGTGIDLYGWSGDAFDNFLSDMRFTYNGLPANPEFTPVSATYVDNGLSTVVARAEFDFDGNGRSVVITRTVEIQGSYLRMTLDMSGAVPAVIDNIRVRLVGDLGGDASTVLTPVGATGVVSTDGLNPQPSDPVVGYDFAGLAAPVLGLGVGDPDLLVVDFAGRSSQSFTLALQEYNPCSYDAAITAMTAAVPTLASTFGATIAPLHPENCLTIAPLTSTKGTTIDASLALTQSPQLIDQGYFNPIALQNLRVAGIDLPSTLAVSMVIDPATGLPSLKVTGTAPAGTYRVLFYSLISGDGAEYFAYPLVSTLVVTEVLSATGTDTTVMAPGLIGAALFTLLGATLLVVRHRREARR